MPKNNDGSNGAKKLLMKAGIVTSDKMQKTIVVRIDTTTRHPLYKKVMRKSMKVKVHDEKNVAKAGDKVKIVQTRPLSKDKRWRLLEVTAKKV